MQTIDLIARAPEKYEVVALTANKNVTKLAEQARALKARIAVVADDSQYAALKDALAGTGIEAAAGAKAVVEAAQMESDWVMSAIVGLPGCLARWPPLGAALPSPLPTRKRWCAPVL